MKRRDASESERITYHTPLSLFCWHRISNVETTSLFIYVCSLSPRLSGSNSLATFSLPTNSLARDSNVTRLPDCQIQDPLSLSLPLFPLLSSFSSSSFSPIILLTSQC